MHPYLLYSGFITWGFIATLYLFIDTCIDLSSRLISLSLSSSLQQCAFIIYCTCSKMYRVGRENVPLVTTDLSDLYVNQQHDGSLCFGGANWICPSALGASWETWDVRWVCGVSKVFLWVLMPVMVGLLCQCCVQSKWSVYCILYIEMRYLFPVALALYRLLGNMVHVHLPYLF